MRWLTGSLSLVVAVVGALGLSARADQAIAYGTITPKPTWAVGQASSEATTVTVANRGIGDASVALQPTAALTIHTARCPADVAPSDRYAQCHANGRPGVGFVLQGPVQGRSTTSGALGAVHWDDLPAGVYTVAEAAPTGEFVDYAVVCSRLDAAAALPVAKRGDGRAAIQVELGVGAQVVCDWYDIAPVSPPLLDFRIAAFTCPTDPGRVSLAAGNLPAACQPAVGVVFAVTGADGSWLAGCTAGADGRCVVRLPNDAAVTVTEEVTTAPPGYAPRENPIATAVRTEFAGALFINLPRPQPSPTPPAPGEGRPVDLRTGTCDRLAPSPRSPLTGLTTPAAPPEGARAATVAAASVTVLDVTVDALLATPHVIDVQGSATRGAAVACGEIGGPRRADGSVVIGLREQHASGLVGIAVLLPDPNDPRRTRVVVFLASGLAEGGAPRPGAAPIASSTPPGDG